MATGMSFTECVELRLMPLAGADPAFFQAAEMERNEMFPMTLGTASNHLRSRGYDARPEMLEVLVEDDVITPDAKLGWSQENVDEAAAYFERCGLFTPYAAMCETMGCGYADFQRALRAAAEAASKQYGRHVPDDDQLFVMHREPPRGDRPAKLSFTLCDDIRERLERGEEV